MLTVYSLGLRIELSNWHHIHLLILIDHVHSIHLCVIRKCVLGLHLKQSFDFSDITEDHAVKVLIINRLQLLVLSQYFIGLLILILRQSVVCYLV